MKVYCVWLIDQSSEDEKNLIIICDSDKSAFNYINENYGEITYIRKDRNDTNNITYYIATRQGPDEYFIDIVEHEVYQMKK